MTPPVEDRPNRDLGQAVAVGEVIEVEPVAESARRIRPLGARDLRTGDPETEDGEARQDGAPMLHGLRI